MIVYVQSISGNCDSCGAKGNLYHDDDGNLYSPDPQGIWIEFPGEKVICSRCITIFEKVSRIKDPEKFHFLA